MNALDPAAAPERARIDAEGRLVSAEGRLHDLNQRAGGAIGAPLAVPQLAALARLAQRLGVPIARTVIAADGGDDLELSIRAAPDADGVRLELCGWQPRPGWHAAPDAARRDGDFFQSSADLRWETDATLRITFVSIEAGARHGFDGPAMLGQPLTRLFSLAREIGGDLPIRDALGAQAGFDGQEAEIRGTGRRVRLEATPRTDSRGRFAGFVGAAHLLDAAPEADSHTPAPGGFPASFGRRLDRALRGPLDAIIANADSMCAGSDGPLKGDYANYAGDIASAGRHLMGLVDDLVDLQGIEHDDFAIDFAGIDLADATRRAAGLLAARAAEREVRIDRPTPQDALPATGEFRRALQVLVNLIGNAVRYSPPGGKVWIRFATDGTRVHVIVADQGKGIAAEDHERIFAKFGRVDPGEPGGSGLGLYIARRLARAMGGDIIVDSAPGDGARFVFSLPRPQ